MGYVNDPDMLDRYKVIFDPFRQRVSIRPMGETKIESFSGQAYDGMLCDEGFNFLKVGVAPGDVVAIPGSDTDDVDFQESIGHYTVRWVEPHCITLDRSIGGDTPPGSITYRVTAEPDTHVFVPAGTVSGELYNGLTLQVLYSFAMEEWKAQSYGLIDLMAFTFPFTAITREQLILGGHNADAASAWTFANNNGSGNPRCATRALIRNGGWQEKDARDTILREFAGIVTLGDMPRDRQIFYQQYEGGPVIPFLRTGAVNEAIEISDYKGLRLTVAGSDARADLSHAGIRELEPICNRFPLVVQEPTPSITSSADGLEDRLALMSFAIATSLGISIGAVIGLILSIIHLSK